MADGSRDVRKAKKTPIKRKPITGAKGGEATSRTPIEAPDSLLSTAMARILDLLSEGEIEGFASGTGQEILKDIYLDETPIANADGSLNFANVSVDSRLGTQTQDYMVGFPTVESEIGIGVELTNASGGFVRAVNNLQLDAIRILIGVNSLSKQDVTTGDIDGYRIDYAIDLKVDSGAYVQVFTGAFNGKTTSKYQRSHRIDLPPAVTNWTFRVRRLTADTTASTIQDTTMIDSYTEIIDARMRYPMSALCGVIVDASQFRSIPTRSYRIKGRKVSIPTNYNPLTRVYTGTWDGTFKNAWTNNPAWIYFDILINARYGLGSVITASQIDKWSLYAIAQYCDGFVPTGFIKRATATTGSITISTSATDNSYNRTTGDFLADGFAAGDEINASAGFTGANAGRGVIKSVTALKIILNDSSALTTTAATAGRTLVTQDPTEPRFTASIFLQRQEEAYKVIQDLASIFRGISYWAGGAIVPVCDMPSDPVYVYNNSNVLNGKFTYQGSGRRARHTVALVSWSDPNDFGRTKVEYVPDDTGIARYGIQQTQVNAIGCTSQGTARRIGRWILLSERLETDTVTFDVGLDGTLAAPGQIVRVADSARSGKRMGGRVSASTLTTVTVDAIPTPPPIVGDKIIVTLPTGVTTDKTITSINTSTRVVGFSTLAAGMAPVVGSSWAFETALLTQLFRVVSVRESKTADSIGFGITALQHEPQKFDAVELGLLIQPRNISDVPTGVQAAPTGLSLTATPRAGSVLAQTYLTAAWTKAPQAVYYEVQFREGAHNWSPVVKVYGTSVQYNQGFSGNWAFRISSVNATNKRSVPVFSPTVFVLDQTKQPTALSDAANAAATASADAAAANADIANMTSDNKLSIVEKKRVINDYNILMNDQAGIDAQATSFGITTEKTAYDTALSALTTYLGTVTSPVPWNDLTNYSTVVGATFRSKFADAYNKEVLLLNKIYASAKVLANNAQTAANNAQTDASAANLALADISSDSLLTPGEKPVVIKDRDRLVNEQAGIDAQATQYGVTTEKTTYDNAISALVTYLATLTTPTPWYQLSPAGNTTIVGATFRTKFLDAYDARSALLRKIADLVTYGNSAGRGQNLMLDEYSRFTNTTTLPALLDSGTTISQAYDSTVSLGASGGSLRVLVNDPAGGTSVNWIFFGSSGTDYNVKLEGGKKYIVSGYQRSNGSGIITQLCLKSGDGVIHYGANNPATVANTWTRVSTVVDLTAYVGSEAELLMYFNRQGSTTSYWVYLDRLMVEEQFGAQSTPSTWVAGGSGLATANAKAAADSAQLAANNAQSSANNATADIAQMASDNWLTVVEKKRIVNDWNVLYNEHASIIAQAAMYEVRDELTNYNTAYSALSTYLLSLSPAYSDLTAPSSVVGGTLRTKFADCYQNRQVLLQKIADLILYGDDYVGSDNLMPNPQFKSNKVNAPINAIVPVNTALCDGYVVSNAGTSDTGAEIFYDGSAIRCTITGAASLAINAIREVKALTPNLYVQPTKTYEFGFDWVAVSYNGSILAGVTVAPTLSIRWYDSANAQISYVAGPIGTRVTNSAYSTLVAPANASYCRIEVRAYIYNQSGAAWQISMGSGTVALNGKFTNVFMRKLEDLAVAGSGYRLGDQRNSLMVRVGSTGSRWSGAAITYSVPTTGSPAVVTINVAAGTLQCGSAAVAYSASSGTVSQTRSTTVTYYLYYSDNDYSGGAKTLNITTNAANLSNADDRAWIGSVDVTTPAVGTGSSGGGGAGGGCVDGAMWIDGERQAEMICVPDLIDIVDERKNDGTPRMARRRVGRNVMGIAPCYRIVSEGGAELCAAETTPFTQRDGSSRLIAEMMNGEVITDCDGELKWERIVHCEFIGNRPVAHISVENGSYFAGVDPNYRIASHNALKP